MSTPPLPSIPFSIAHPQQSYRLLELPPDLITLLTSDDKPEFLDLKSSGGGDSDTNNNNSNGQLYLCTSTLSWAVRQVSTSNSVHVTVPIGTIPKSLEVSTTTIAAVAKPSSHLELIGAITTAPPSAAAASSSSSSSPPWLREIVQGVKSVVPTVEGEVGLGTEKVAKEQVFAALPYPRAWIERALSDVLCFAVPATDSKGRARGHDFVYIPSPSLVVDAWMRFTRAVAEHGVDIVDGVDVQRVIEAMVTAEEEDGEGEYGGVIAAGVMRAVLARFSSTVAATDMDRDTVMTTDIDDPTEHKRQLQAQALTLFLGRALVKAEAKSTTTIGRTTTSITKSKLLQKWTALIPLSWERHCIVEELGSGIRIAAVEGGGRGGEEEEVVYWDGDDDDREGEGEEEGRKQGIKGGSSSSSSGGQGDNKKRKWHDMFAKERRNG